MNDAARAMMAGLISSGIIIYVDTLGQLLFPKALSTSTGPKTQKHFKKTYCPAESGPNNKDALQSCIPSFCRVNRISTYFQFSTSPGCSLYCHVGNFGITLGRKLILRISNSEFSVSYYCE